MEQIYNLENVAEYRKWYAVHTRSRHEKFVAKKLEDRQMEVFLPLYKTLNQWKDRKKLVWLPLFRCYLFVMSAPEKWFAILKTQGVVRILGNGKEGFVPIPQAEIDRVRHIVEVDFKKDPCPFITEGNKIYIKSGPLEGLEGILLKKKNEYRVVVSIELLQRSVSVTVDTHDIKLL